MSSGKPSISSHDFESRKNSLQNTVLRELDGQNDREILWVWFPRPYGMIASSMGMYMYLFRMNVVRVPASAVRRAEDIMRWVYVAVSSTCARERECVGVTEQDRWTVVVDLPRSAVVGEELLDVLRDIKSGYLFDAVTRPGEPLVVFPPKMLVTSAAEPVGLCGYFAEFCVGDFFAPVAETRTSRLVTQLCGSDPDPDPDSDSDSDEASGCDCACDCDCDKY